MRIYSIFVHLLWGVVVLIGRSSIASISWPDRSWSGARRMASWVWDHPIPWPFKPIQDDTNNRDWWRQRQDRRPLSDFIIWLNHEVAAAKGGGVGGKGLTRSTITAARAFGVSSGAAPLPPSDYGSMAPPRSCCVFSFLVYVLSHHSFSMFTQHITSPLCHSCF